MDKGRILIVDDQHEIIRSLQAILADEGYDVITAEDGQEALHAVQNESPDVVFLDVWIPGIDGMQTLKAIRRIDPQCTIVMMSGHGTIETAVKAIKLGATDYLEKPLNLDDVLHLVEKSVAAGSAADRPTRVNGSTPDLLIGASDRAVNLRRAVKNAAAETGSVWLVGAKGAGKEFAARIIHGLEGKDRASLIKVRCSDLTEANFEERLLGKSNDANSSRQGSLQLAVGGMLLLIGIDRLRTSLRPRLVELVQNFSGQPHEKASTSQHRFRIVSTSTIDPETLVSRSDFPGQLLDLFAQRIIRLPTLSQRAQDIPLFVEHFLKEASNEFDREITEADKEAMAGLSNYEWPGNVKELKILLEHAVMTAPGPRITANDLLIPGMGRTLLDDRQPSGPRAQRVDPFDAPPSSLPEVTAREKPLGIPEERPGRPGRALRQTTLKGKVVMYGQGLHSGAKTGLTLSPLPPGSGIVFGHITSEGTVRAALEEVESTEMATSLTGPDCSARTIEHLMAVFHVYGLTNLLVKISGEVPIMDGSALEFCHLVESAEILTQDEPVREVRVTEPIELTSLQGASKSMKVEPSDLFVVEYHMDYPPPIGKLHMTYRCNDPEDFKEQIAPARTFGFVKDMRMMDEMGLAGGGRLSNVVLLDDEKVVNPPLRFPDEFVRHKILDIIGDFYLLGRPFIGKVTARQTGHTENVAMLKLIKEKMAIG